MGKKSRKKKAAEGQPKPKEKTTPKKKFPLLPLIIVVVAVAALGFFVYPGTDGGKASAGKLSMADMAALKGNETKPTLSPSLFRGTAAYAYKVAGDNKDLLDYMYCYCNCKNSIGHKSLLSCFTDNHAANCGICQDQAIYAVQLKDKGYDIARIREMEDKKFWQPLR